MPKKVDANQPAIVKAFRERGWTVKTTHTLGSGFPDLLVAKRGVLKQIEVKNQAGRGLALTPDEKAYHADLLLADCPVLVVASEADVIAVDRLFGGA